MREAREKGQAEARAFTTGPSHVGRESKIVVRSYASFQTNRLIYNCISANFKIIHNDRHF